MGMQKYRADNDHAQADYAIVWYSKWMGGPSLARINDCVLENMAGDMRATVYITGEADSFFSIPAVCSIRGCSVRGYVTSDDNGNIVFRHCYY